ncbi:MAG: exosome complex protein Rrp42 [Candidatus Woesearchaeota archaeon]|nr:exosome complex protein Rrp42 [Candidatus Woesearchaeota archaeon]
MINELRTHVIETLEKGTRFDGRKSDQVRDVSVETGVTKNAEGSARVKIGDTEVIAGVKLSIEKPYPDSPDNGNLMVNVELLPLSSPEFDTGPPGIKAIELARVVDRGIRESKAIDTKKLCVEKGEKVWTISIDIISINDAGNLFDAAALAALASIKDAVFPKVSKSGEIDYKELTKDKLPLAKEPIEVTVWKIGEHFIVDPTPDEEKVADARLTIASLSDKELCALQKGGEEPLSIEEIGKMLDVGLSKAGEYRSKL